MKIAVLPNVKPSFADAIRQAGCELAELTCEVKALVWTDYSAPGELNRVIAANPQLEWVQLPFAGVDAFASTLALPPMFTSAKGAYSEPVAEHVLALMLSLGRAIPERVRATTWGSKFAVSIYESKVVIVGNGGIAKELIKLLEPFGNEVVALGRGDLGSLDSELPTADFVVLACALTDQTRGLFNAARFKAMKPTAYLVNVARGPVVVTTDLEHALRTGQIAGAGIDVTDPEPLPDGHPLWTLENLIITPHTADTDAQVVRMFAERIRVNSLAFRGAGDWVGVVDKELGY